MHLIRKVGIFCLLGLFLWVGPLFAQQESGKQIRKGDKLNILVVGSGQPVQTFQVSRNGYILIPNIGKVEAFGKNIESLESVLKEKYSQRYPNATVAVTIEAAIQASQNIYVLGEVRSPGVHSIRTAISVVKALALAGGFTDKADTREVRIIRKNDPQSRERFNWEMYNQGQTKAPNVEPEDVVIVEARKFSHFFILGSVNSPGRYVIPQAVSFLEALSMAGGFTANATSPDVTLIRGDTHKEMVINNIRQKLTSKEVTALKINPGDTLVVALSTKSSITIMGVVGNPGRYSLKGDSTDLMQALSLAGGLGQGAGEASIIRKGGAIESVDLKNLSSIKNTSELPKVNSGDMVMVSRAVSKLIYVLGQVKAPGAFPITNPVQLHQALAMAGDISKWGSRNGLRIIRASGAIQTFDLGDALGSANAKAIPVLNSGDTLFIP